eukprot:gene31203-38554_t
MALPPQRHVRAPLACCKRGFFVQAHRSVTLRRQPLNSLLENTGGRHYPAAIAIAGALMALFWPNGGWYGILGALAFLAAGGYAWLQLSGGSGSDARSGVQDYLDGRQQFAEQVTPVWCRHIESSRSQMEEAVAELATRFSTIVDKLDDTLRLSNAAADNQDGASLGQVFAHSERQLGEVVATMKSALASKHAMLTRIRRHRIERGVAGGPEGGRELARAVAEA